MPDAAPFLLDVTRLIWRRWKGRLPTGIDRVCLAYLRHFGGRSHAVINHERFRTILNRQASQELFGILENPPRRFRTRLITGTLRHLRAFNEQGQERLYLNVGHTGLDSPGFGNWISRSRIRPVYLVHDLIPITHPQFCRTGEEERHRIRMRTVLETASGLIGNSQATIDELSDFANSHRLPMPPAIAAWLGIGDLPQSAAGRTMQRPSFITLGTIEGRKNHLLLLDIWSRLIDRLGNGAPRLLIIGQRGWKADVVFDRLDQDEKLRGHVIELSRCSDKELAQHLTSARALLFPSLAEGYGLPLVEALSAGMPVIASDLPALREIGGRIPTYLHAQDHSAWEDTIVDYTRPESRTRAAQLDRMKGFCAPTWEWHFQKVEAWLSTLR